MTQDSQERRGGLANAQTEYSDREFALYLRRSFARSMGFSGAALAKPIVGIVNTFSEFNNCHRDVPGLVQAVKRGVWQAGGLPLEFPTISLGEVFLAPTAMLYRNLMSIDVEAMVKAQPLDSVVLIGGCDKTVPALLMGAASAGLPAIQVVTGPMLTGSYEGERLGACTDCRRWWAKYRRGEIDSEGIQEVEGRLAATSGTCSVMGTASTMACVAEALGMMLPGSATIPAVHADRLRNAEESGTRAVGLIAEKLTPDRIMTERAFENALRVLLAIGGSTNAIIHLTAIAGRLGIRLDLDRLDRLSDETPVLVDLKPTGDGYMEDFHRAGGMQVLLQELKPRLHLDVLTVSGRTLGEVLDVPYTWPTWQSVIRPVSAPLQQMGALAVLRGNLAPDGAILKRSAATPELLNRTGRAVVFTSLRDVADRIDDPNLDVQPDDFLVLQNAGPVGAPGMPEAGYLPIPRKLAATVRDMVRISDARMSGTAFGTVVLHVSPEAAVGGPLALVRTGDQIRLSLDDRTIDLLVSEEELAKRRAEWSPPAPMPARGYERLYSTHVQQAHLGADFDFLRSVDDQ
jgi:dihydroxy-acid dehydratase